MWVRLPLGAFRGRCAHLRCRLDDRLRWGLCWYGQAAVNRRDAGSIPATAARTKRACPWPSGRGAGLPSRRPPSGGPGSTPAGHFVTELCHGMLGDRLTVGCLSLKQVMKVRILLPEPLTSESVVEENMIAGQLLLVVTPDSGSGGRWFDSSSRNFVHANLGKSSGRMRGLSRKQVFALGGLWVRVPRLPPSSSTVRETKSRGPAATTPGLHPGNDGSSPSGITVAHKQIACRRHHPARRSSRSSPECSPGCQPGDRGFESHRGR